MKIVLIEILWGFFFSSFLSFLFRCTPANSGGISPSVKPNCQRKNNSPYSAAVNFLRKLIHRLVHSIPLYSAFCPISLIPLSLRSRRPRRSIKFSQMYFGLRCICQLRCYPSAIALASGQRHVDSNPSGRPPFCISYWAPLICRIMM